MNGHYETIIVDASKKDSSNLDADKVNRGKTGQTFTVDLSKDGKLPATHHICHWWLSDEETNELKKDFDPIQSGDKNKSRMFDMRLWTIDQVLADMKLKRIEVDIGVITKPLISRILEVPKSLFGRIYGWIKDKLVGKK